MTVLHNRVQETAAAPGTGNVTPNGAVSGYSTFALEFTAGQTLTYCITDGSQWEEGDGTWNGTVVSRDAVIKTSAGNTTKLNFTTAVRISNVVPAERTPFWGENVALASTDHGKLPMANSTGGGLVLRTPRDLRENLIDSAGFEIDCANLAGGVSVGTSATQGVDRWSAIRGSAGGSATLARSTGVPSAARARYSLFWTTGSPATAGSTDKYMISHAMEGARVRHALFGTASARTLTLSVWLYSSIGGTVGLAIQNDGGTRSYPLLSPSLAAATWTKCTFTVPGCTDGTWAPDNTCGMRLTFDAGSGSSKRGSANAWASADYVGATGGINTVGTGSAALGICEPQLVIGSNAIPFEPRDLVDELAACQRYRQSWADFVNGGVMPSTGTAYAATNAYMTLPLTGKVRTPPTGLSISAAGHFSLIDATVTTRACTALSFNAGGPAAISLLATIGSASLAAGNAVPWQASSASALIYTTGMDLN